MKRTKIFGLIFIFTFLTVGFSIVEAQTSKIKTWKITVSQSGGFSGISKSYTLDEWGNLHRENKNRNSVEKIDESKIMEIGKLIKELNLPPTKLKTVKGDRIFDGIYTSLVINLDGKDYKVEGNTFYDAKYSALTKKQQITLEKLKQRLSELNGFLEDATLNVEN